MKTLLALIGLALCAGITHAQTTNAPPVAIPSTAAPPILPAVLLSPAQIANLSAFLTANVTLPAGLTQAQLADLNLRFFLATGAVYRGASAQTLPLTTPFQRGDVVVPAGVVTAYPNGVVLRGGVLLPAPATPLSTDIVLPAPVVVLNCR